MWDLRPFSGGYQLMSCAFAQCAKVLSSVWEVPWESVIHSVSRCRLAGENRVLHTDIVLPCAFFPPVFAQSLVKIWRVIKRFSDISESSAAFRLWNVNTLFTFLNILLTLVSTYTYFSNTLASKSQWVMENYTRNTTRENEKSINRTQYLGITILPWNCRGSCFILSWLADVVWQLTWVLDKRWDCTMLILVWRSRYVL